MPHIISVDNKETFEKFLNEGYIGVRLPNKFYETTHIDKKKIPNLLATIYDIFADLKRVKVGDEIFIHVKGEQKIYGVFKATSLFKENPQIPKEFRSYNLLEEKFPIEKLNLLFQIDFPWQVSIEPHEQLYFEEGFNANEIFKLKDLCKGIWSIPERWKYDDKEKTVRPLTPDEGKILIDLLRKANSNEPSKLNIKPKDLSNFRPIKLPLLPDKEGYVRHEKLLEAWIMANALQPEDQNAYNNIRQIFGDFSFIANTIRAYYIKFMDIFGYLKKEEKSRLYKIIELKKGKAKKVHVEQLAEYVEWINEFLCQDSSSEVIGFLVAKDFTKPVKDFVRDCSLNIQLVKYELSNERIIFNSQKSASLHNFY